MPMPSAPSGGEGGSPSADTLRLKLGSLADRLDALSDNCAQTAVKSRTQENAEYLLARASTYQECAGLIREALR